MAKYLVSTTETYRVDTEREKKDTTYILGKYTNEHKERKSKGEVVDEYWKLTLTKLFNDIKEPDNVYNVAYEVE